MNYRTRVILLCTIVFLYGAAVFCIYSGFSGLDGSERDNIKIPTNLEDAKILGLVLSKYKADHYLFVLATVISIYILLQSFAIPGSIFLSVLSGYLFNFPVALVLVCSCSAIGASVCYLISSVTGQHLVRRWFPERLTKWQETVSKHRDDMFFYIVFLRVTPFLPNWFINIASPVLDVHFAPFFWGTFVGVAPPSCFFIQTGTTLHDLVVSDLRLSFTSLAILLFFGLVTLLPVVFRQRLRRKMA